LPLLRVFTSNTNNGFWLRKRNQPITDAFSTLRKEFLNKVLAQVSAKGRHVRLVPTMPAVSDRKDLEAQVNRLALAM